MIKYNPKERITANDALQHPWFKQKLHPKIDLEIAKDHLLNLKNFRVFLKY